MEKDMETDDRELIQSDNNIINDDGEHEEEEPGNKTSSECFAYIDRQRAIFYALFSATGAVMVDILVFKVGMNIPAVEVPLWNAAGVSLMSLIAILIARPKLPTTLTEISYVIVGGFLMGTGSTILLMAIIFANPGNAITLYFTLPVFTTLIGAVLFRETPSCLQVLFVSLAVLGVTLVSGPTFIFPSGDMTENKDDVIGLVLAIGSAIVTASGLVTYRQLSKITETPPFLPILIQGLSGLTVSAILCLYDQQFELPRTDLDTIAATCNGILSFTSTIALYFALKVANASYVTIAMTSEVVLSFIAQYLFFKLIPTWNSVVGAVIITATCIGLTLLKQDATQANEHNEQRAPLLQNDKENGHANSKGMTSLKP